MNDELIQVIEDLKMSIYEDMGAETSPNEVEQYVSALLLCLEYPAGRKIFRL